MKKLLLAAALLTGNVAFAQITAEQTYDSKLAGGKLATGEVKFVGYFPLTLTTGQSRIYNTNYSLYKQADVMLPSGYRVENITYVSDKLFNTNALIEVALNIYDPNNGNDGLRIVDENGAVLLAKDRESYPTIYNTPNGTKMVLYNYLADKTTIYALSGTLTPLAAIAATTASETVPHPNPTTADIKLPYSVPTGQIAELVVRDVTGQQVKSYQVDSSFSYLLFSTTGLAPGVYFYTVGTGQARRFDYRGERGSSPTRGACARGRCAFHPEAASTGCRPTRKISPPRYDYEIYCFLLATDCLGRHYSPGPVPSEGNTRPQTYRGAAAGHERTSDIIDHPTKRPLLVFVGGAGGTYTLPLRQRGVLRGLRGYNG